MGTAIRVYSLARPVRRRVRWPIASRAASLSTAVLRRHSNWAAMVLTCARKRATSAWSVARQNAARARKNVLSSWLPIFVRRAAFAKVYPGPGASAASDV